MTTHSEMDRRQWLKITAGVVLTGAFTGAAGCKDNDGNDGLDLGSGDGGLLNLLLALEDLQESFFATLLSSPYADMTAQELMLLNDVRAHDTAHAGLLRILAGSGAVTGLEFSFLVVDFTRKAAVLAAAKTMKDLGSSAYLYAMRHLAGGETLALLSKMASVEARHAAWISDVITPNNFAGGDVVDSTGQERARTANAILALASGYIRTKLNGDRLPV